MLHSEYRVREDHARTRPLHHILDPLPHIRLVAVYLAEGAELFIDLERTLFKAKEGVLAKLPALLAQLPFRAVFAVAIFFYHHGDELFFLLPRFILFPCLHSSPLFAEANLRAQYLFAETNLRAQYLFAETNQRAALLFAFANRSAKFLVRSSELTG